MKNPHGCYRNTMHDPVDDATRKVHIAQSIFYKIPTEHVVGFFEINLQSHVTMSRHSSFHSVECFLNIDDIILYSTTYEETSLLKANERREDPS